MEHGGGGVFTAKRSENLRMSKVVTLTLCPAIDVYCQADDFKPYAESLCEIVERAAGGKGVNISRALNACGVENLAVVVVGDENGKEYLKNLAESGVTEVKAITVGGRVRENFTLRQRGQKETRISFKGFSATDEILKTCEQIIFAQKDLQVVTFTGRIPDGVSLAEVKKLIFRLKEKGIKVVVDSKSFTLKDIEEVKPWLIKPNEEEIAEYLKTPVNGVDEAMDAARVLHGRGIESVMISLGAKGAVLRCGQGEYYKAAPTVEVISTVGAGDSAIAGFIVAYLNGESAENRLTAAVNLGSLVCSKGLNNLSR